MADEKRHKYHADIREDMRELLRQNLVDAADHLLITEGPDALTVRRIAEELDASTKVIYNLFGGKDGLANELYLEGCERLRQVIEAVPSGDSLHAYVTACGWAYWDFAQRNPGYYAVMFGGAIPGFRPLKESLETVATAFGLLIQTLMPHQQALPTHDTAETIRLIWAPLHGVIHLHTAGHYDETEARRLYQQVLGAVTEYLLSP